jgi:hypothetical protein
MRSLFSRNCTHKGAVVEVSYAGMKLVAAPVQRFCANPRKTNEQAVVAWGAGVQAPGFMLDGLAADARRGARVFDVAVAMSGNTSRKQA